MFNIAEDGTIKLTRGDTARFHLGTVTNTATSPATTYTVTSSDKLEFSVKRTARDETYLIHKTIAGGGTFHITPTDTSSMDFGRYVYDVQLTTSTGDIYTLTGEHPLTFILLKEVT